MLKDTQLVKWTFDDEEEAPSFIANNWPWLVAIAVQLL